MKRMWVIPVMALSWLATSATAEVAVDPALSASTTKGVVSSSHGVASAAGIEMLDAGGNAMDAAVATAFTLAVVEPAASGLGGGGLMLWQPAGGGESVFLDYRERAPKALPADAHLKDGKPSGSTMKSGGQAVATPGLVRGLLEAHRAHGKLPLERVMAPALRAANEGFEVTPFFNEVLEDQIDVLAADDGAAALFLTDGVFPLEPGMIVKQPALAATLAAIVADGESALYEGERAATLAATVQERGGHITPQDLADYATRTFPPIVIHYHGYELHTAPPPSSGGIELALVLGALDRYNLDGFGPNEPEVLALMMALGNEAQRIVRANVADPATAAVDIAAMTSPASIDALIASVKWARADAPPVALDEAEHDPKLLQNSPGNTTHLSVIDADGNAVALTQTINYRFGSGVYVAPLGFFLNNEMYDFTFEDGSVNLPAPGKTPRSSMSPTIVLRDGKVVGVVGSPGGTRIPWAVARTITGVVDFDLSLSEAIALPRFSVDSTKKEISHEARLDAATIDRAVALLNGWDEFKRRPLKDFDVYLGGVNACWTQVDANGVATRTGSADPRRAGVVGVQK